MAFRFQTHIESFEHVVSLEYRYRSHSVLSLLVIHCSFKEIAVIAKMLSFLSLAFVSIVPSALAAPLGESFDFLPRAQSTGCEALSKTYPSLTFSPNSTIYGQENTGKRMVSQCV